MRSNNRQDPSSEVSRCAVEIGNPASRAISVNECSLPSVKVIRMALTLLVTDRPTSAELPATKASLDSLRVLVIGDVAPIGVTHPAGMNAPFGTKPVNHRRLWVLHGLDVLTGCALSSDRSWRPGLPLLWRGGVVRRGATQRVRCTGCG